MHKRFSDLTGVIIIALIVAGVIAVYDNRYAITDWYFLRNYTPSAQVAALADQAGFTPKGRALFYRADPQIVTQRAAMISYCDITDNQVAELGCYLSTDHIYLLAIAEPNLKNEMATTSGYEMLHSAYQRLSGSQRRTTDAELEQVAAHITDPHILDQIQIYAKTEPGARDDELYSVLGTEYTGALPPALIADYNQYFSNRSQLVAYHQQFEQTFDSLHTQITQLSGQIDAQKTAMSRYLAAGQVGQYNDLVPVINVKITTYNGDVQLYNQYGRDILGTQSSASAQ